MPFGNIDLCGCNAFITRAALPSLNWSAEAINTVACLLQQYSEQRRTECPVAPVKSTAAGRGRRDRRRDGALNAVQTPRGAPRQPAFGGCINASVHTAARLRDSRALDYTRVAGQSRTWDAAAEHPDREKRMSPEGKKISFRVNDHTTARRPQLRDPAFRPDLRRHNGSVADLINSSGEGTHDHFAFEESGNPEHGVRKAERGGKRLLHERRGSRRFSPLLDSTCTLVDASARLSRSCGCERGIDTPAESRLPRGATAEFERDSELPSRRLSVARRGTSRSALDRSDGTTRFGAVARCIAEKTSDRVYCLVRSSSKTEAAARVMKALQRTGSMFPKSASWPSRPILAGSGSVSSLPLSPRWPRACGLPPLRRRGQLHRSV